MTPASLLTGTLLSFALVPQARPPAPPTADAFATGLTRVQTTLEGGQFKRANDALFDLLFQHRDADYAVRRQLEIVDLARRCAFGMEQPPPKLADLVSGELIRWDADLPTIVVPHLKLYSPGRVKAAGLGGAERRRHALARREAWRGSGRCYFLSPR